MQNFPSSPTLFSVFLKPVYAVVDIETTGGNPDTDRIIEIAIYITDGHQVLDQYSSLVNPEAAIPPFVQYLTGIKQHMVSKAPKFEEIAATVAAMVTDKIFVAHNVGFDYYFVKNSLKRYGFNYSSKRICTVRLSRKILPGLPSYSLGKLCRSLQIDILDRHRASGDAEATTQLLHLLIQNDRKKYIEKTIRQSAREAVLPPHLPREVYDELPHAPGVYYFLDEQQRVIYIGKAKNIKKRVGSHFTNHLNKRNVVSYKNHIRDIHFQITGSELIAFLLESFEIKRLKPKFNRAQRRVELNYGIFCFEDQKGYLRLGVDVATPAKRPLVSFPGLIDARSYLLKMAERFELCKKLVHLQQTQQACNGYYEGFCLGACVHQEKATAYNKRVEEAIEHMENSESNLMILGHGRHEEERSVVCCENGKFLGFGYFSKEIKVQDIEEMKTYISPYPDNLDVQRIIRSYMKNGIKKDKIIRY